jgi:hypothetical protein
MATLLLGGAEGVLAQGPITGVIGSLAFLKLYASRARGRAEPFFFARTPSAEQPHAQ